MSLPVTYFPPDSAPTSGPQPGDFFVVDTGVPFPAFTGNPFAWLADVFMWFDGFGLLALYCLITRRDAFNDREGFYAWAIRFVTGSEVSHAGILIDHFGGTVEAFPGGAEFQTAEDDFIWSSCDLTPEQRDAIVNAAWSLVGTPYSMVDVVCVGLARIFGVHVPEPVRARLRRVRNPRQDGRRLMCSQLVDTAYLMAGIHLFDDGRLPGDVAPGDLHEIIRNGSRIPVR